MYYVLYIYIYYFFSLSLYMYIYMYIYIYIYERYIHMAEPRSPAAPRRPAAGGSRNDLGNYRFTIYVVMLI